MNEDNLNRTMLQKLENEEVIYTADGDPNDPTYAFLGA
jgi:hypothetical protein